MGHTELKRMWLPESFDPEQVGIKPDLNFALMGYAALMDKGLSLSRDSRIATRGDGTLAYETRIPLVGTNSVGPIALHVFENFDSLGPTGPQQLYAEFGDGTRVLVPGQDPQQ